MDNLNKSNLYLNDNLDSKSVPGSEKAIVLIMYLSSLIGVFAFSNLIIPLILWIWKKDSSDSINKHGVNVINFQISITIWFLMLFVLGILCLMLPPCGLLVFAGIFAVFAYDVIKTVISIFKYCNGEFYELPTIKSFVGNKKN